MNDKTVGRGRALPNRGAASSAPTSSRLEICNSHDERLLRLRLTMTRAGQGNNVAWRGGEERVFSPSLHLKGKHGLTVPHAGDRPNLVVDEGQNLL